jgi:hypothetical protein
MSEDGLPALPIGITEAHPIVTGAQFDESKPTDALFAFAPAEGSAASWALRGITILHKIIF